MTALDRALAPLLAEQRGVIARRQALDLGASPSAVKRRVQNGSWTLTEPGVYALAGVPWDWRRHLVVAALSVRGAVVSHRAAATLLGVPLDERRPVPFELSVPASRRPKRPFDFTQSMTDHAVIVHESVDLDRFRPSFVDGLAVTPPRRLAVDLGAVVPFDQYRRSVAWMRRHDLLDWHGTDLVYRQHSARGRNGCGPIRDLLDLHEGVEAAPPEVIEIRCADLLVGAGLPTPVPQYEVRRPSGRIALIDLAYPEVRVGIETEGRIHDDSLVRQRDHERRNDLLLLGWTMLHFTWEDIVHRPWIVVRTVQRALAHAAA